LWRLSQKIRSIPIRLSWCDNKSQCILVTIGFLVLNNFLVAQSFSGNTGIIIDYVGEPSPSIFELEVDNLPDALSSDYGIESVCMHIRHGRTRDLKIELLSPSGTRVWLSNRNSDPLNYGFYMTCFNQDGFNGHIIEGGNRFEGEYIPEGRLEYFNNGQNPNGSWFLIISDLEEGDIGKLLEWKIVFGSNPADGGKVHCQDMSLGKCLAEKFPHGKELLPDLILSTSLTMNHITYFPKDSDEKEYRNQLRFAAAMANIGLGPLEITGDGIWSCGNKVGSRTEPCPDGSYPRQRVYQKIYKIDQDTIETISNPGGTLYYDTQPGHNHYHADHWVRYSLLKKKWWCRNPKKWKVISTSDKVSYCLYDNKVCTEENAFCVDNDKVYSSNNLENYGFGNFTSCNSYKQGISVGGLDYYGKFYEGQHLNLPDDLEEGTYYLFIEIDPENYYREVDETNNNSLIKVTFAKDDNGQLYLK